MSGTATASPPRPPPAVPKPLSWQRLVLLIALLNAPLYFNGCDSKETRFSIGTAIPFAEIVSRSQKPFGPVTVTWWSSWRCAANFTLIAAAVWLSCRYFAWIAGLAQSRWLIGTLVFVALLFNSWWFLPEVWFHAVFTPVFQVSTFLQWIFDALPNGNHSPGEFAIILGGRLYFAACVCGIGSATWAVRVFLKRYFFVQSGRGWQIQLGGLITVMLVLGTAIGIIARLMMQQQN
jgi:hypothetical protein